MGVDLVAREPHKVDRHGIDPHLSALFSASLIQRVRGALKPIPHRTVCATNSAVNKPQFSPKVTTPGRQLVSREIHPNITFKIPPNDSVYR